MVFIILCDNFIIFYTIQILNHIICVYYVCRKSKTIILLIALCSQNKFVNIKTLLTILTVVYLYNFRK